MSIQIGEFTKRTACPIQTIRYYECEGLLPPPDRNSGSFQLYSERYVEWLQPILHYRSLDMPLNDVRTLLCYHERPDEDCGAVNTFLDKYIEEIERRIGALGMLRHHLCVLRETCSDGRAAEVCGILQELSEGSNTCTGDGTHH